MAMAAAGKPHGDQQPTVVQLDAMPGAGGHHVPVVVLAELLEGRGDVRRGGERLAVVVAPHVVAAGVVDLVEEMDRPRLAVHDRRGVVGGRLALAHEDLRRLPGLARIETPPHGDVDVVPVADAVLAGGTVGQHDAPSGHHDPGDAVGGIAVLAGLEKISLDRGPFSRWHVSLAVGGRRQSIGSQHG